MVKKIVFVTVVIATTFIVISIWPSSNVNNSDVGPIDIEIKKQYSITAGTSPKPVAMRNIGLSVSSDEYQSKYGALPSSLRGTTISVPFIVNDDGHLVITPSIKTMIEYFLSATGEEPLDIIVKRIHEFIAVQLKEPARSEAVDVVDQYMAYKQALVEVERNLSEDVKMSGKGSDYLMMFNLRRETRIAYLGQEVYDAFFADEDKEDRYTVKVLEVRGDDSLSESEKTKLLQDAESLLPSIEQSHKQKERTRDTLNKNISDVKVAGGGETEIFQLRAEAYGYEAAERFAIADREVEKWNERFNSYRQQRQHILDSSGLSVEDSEWQVEVLRKELFSETEQLRIRTLDRVADK